MNTTKIEDVNIEFLSKRAGTNQEYTDGPIEDEMLALVKSSDYINKKHKMLADKPSWPMYYHFTPLRGNLINWKAFSKKSKILEVGAGCGGITEALLEVVDKSIKIDALELSEKRAVINAYRNRNKKNLRLIVGNLEDFKETGYDYVICVGVLEYSGKFISGSDPFGAFVKKLHGFLKPEGELLLAIENKMGVKYINGAREDHLGKYYESLMDYPGNHGVKTFSKKELTALFRNAGFKNIELLFPIPDYKIPTMVLHENIFETTTDLSFISRNAPAPAMDQSRIHSASEQLVTRSVVNAGLFPELSNSFLVQAKR